MKIETFFDKFDQLVDGPDAVAKMRELVLELAVQGKLVPQDPNDAPARNLISQIAEEKRGLVAAKIIREKDEALPIVEDEIPFEAPFGWEWARLSSITRRIHYGYTASAKLELSDVRLLRITDIQNNFVDWPSVPGCEIAQEDVTQYQLERGDILVARTGGTVGKTYLVQDVPVVAVFASYLIRIQGGSSLFDRYLKLFLESPIYWVQLEEGARGAAQPNVNGQTLGQMVISVPPLAEQKRIVAKVDELMAICDRLEAQLKERETKLAALSRASLSRFAESPTPANLEYVFHKSYSISPTDLRKSILTLAVQGKLVPQDPNDEPAEALLNRLRAEKLEKIRQGTMRKRRSNEDSFLADTETPLPAGWASGCVADFGAPEDNAIVDGPFGSNLKLSDYDPHGVYPVITISNIDEGFNLSTLRKVTEKKFQELKRSAVRANDILVAKIGSSYGKVGLYPDNMPVGIIPANLLKITPHPLMDWRFLVIALRSPDFKAALELIVQFTAQPAFGVSKFKLLPISVPPLAEQRRIVAKVDQLMALVDQLETQLITSRATATDLMKAVVSELTAA